MRRRPLKSAGGARALPLVLLLGLAACASIAPPPGGPTDLAPPVLVSVRPESTAVYADFDGDAEFRFDEVVAEGSSPNFGLGTGDLERLVLLSPSHQVPSISWKRNRITVHPREGWQKDRIYRIELLPGIVDLAANRTHLGRVITFSTGAPLPETVLRGMVVDWTTRRPLPNALVEAVLAPDSLPYRSVTDSTGRFSLGPLPRGEYLVYGAIDQNNDRRRQARESWDSLRILAGRDSVGQLWTFRHDTLPARVTSVDVIDSLSLGLTFSQQLDPYQRLPADSVEVRLLPDSTPALPVLGILPKGAFDTAYPPARVVDTARIREAAARARADSIQADSLARAREAAAIRIPGADRRRPAVRDTTGTGPLLTKPPLFDRLQVRVGSALAPGGRYVVIVHGLKTVSGVVGIATGVAAVPDAKPPSDSTRARPDTTARKPRQ